MTQRVVDVLEVVQVEEQHCNETPSTLGQSERVLHAIPEQVAICKQRQRIVEGELPQLLLERFAFADIAKTERQTAHRGILRQVAAHPFQYLVVGVAGDSQLHRTDHSGRRGGDFGQEFLQFFAVLAHTQVEQTLAGNLLRPETQGARGSRRYEAQRAVRIDDHDHVGGVCDQRRIAGFDDARGIALTEQRIAAQHYSLSNHEQQHESKNDHGDYGGRAADIIAAQVHEHHEGREHRGVWQRAGHEIRSV